MSKSKIKLILGTMAFGAFLVGNCSSVAMASPGEHCDARQMGADIVVAVDISSAPEGNKSDDMLKILLQTFTIMSKSINTFELAQADIVVKPSLLGVSSVEFANRQQNIDAGRAAMKLALPRLKALLNNEKISSNQ